MKKAGFIYAGDFEKIPDGNYEIIFTKLERSNFFKRDKLYLWGKVVSIGPYEGKEIFMPFNLAGKIVKGSKYYQAWLIANKGVRPKKNDRLSPKKFIGKPFKVKTRIVTNNQKNTALPAQDQYSVIDEILEYYL